GELAGLRSPEEERRRLGGERDAARSEYLRLAAELSRKRRAAAPRLEKKVEAELADLSMEKTRFRVRVAPESAGEADTAAWTECGIEAAEFLLSPNPGEPLRPLARIASGGELSRILLAFKSVASLDAPGSTLVFDEVDAGIGGAVAESV